MKITDVKDLQKVIRLCRQEGVDKIKIDNVEIELGLAPIKQSKTKAESKQQTIAPGGITQDVKIEMPQELTEEQLLFYSVGTNEG